MAKKRNETNDSSETSKEEESSEEEKKPKREKKKDFSEESSSSFDRKSKKKKKNKKKTSSSESSSSDENKRKRKNKPSTSRRFEDYEKLKEDLSAKFERIFQAKNNSFEATKKREMEELRRQKEAFQKELELVSKLRLELEELEEELGITREKREYSPPSSNLGQTERKSEEERETDWMNKEKGKFDQGFGSLSASQSLVPPENLKKEIVLSSSMPKRNYVHRISIEKKESEISSNEEKRDSLDEEGPKKELTIVLIGGSGCGKTTLINSFNNYFRYSTFDRVQVRGVKICIPTRFSSFIDENQTTIQPKMTKASGDEGNEDLEGGGRSVTQEPMTHTFRYKGLKGDVYVNFIDTPGMSDIDGDEKDGDHIENIMKYLEKLEKIDAICMVLKPNESKLAYSFRSAINKLLDRLPKTTYSNILLCFTCTNATNFKPSETLFALRTYFTETGRKISLEKKNMFCFDNEPFRYLCLVKEYPNEMDEEYTDTCRKIYDHSVGELTRLIELVEKLPSFKFKNLLPQQIKGLALRLKECSKISEPTKQNVPQSNELSKEHSVYQQTIGLFSIEKIKKNQQDIVYRHPSPPQATRKEEVISKKEQPSITSKGFATTYDLETMEVVEDPSDFDPSLLVAQPSTNIYPSPIEYQIYNDFPVYNRVIPTQKVEDNQPGSSTFAKDQNIEEVEIDARETINNHPIYGLTKERTFDLVQALAKELARIVEDNISRSYFLTEVVKDYTTLKEEKEKILYPYCDDCHGLKCLALSFAFGVCEACTHHQSKHHYTSSEIDREKILIEIRKFTSAIDENKKELAKLETLQDIIQTACVQFSIFRLTQTNHFSTTFIDYILDTANKEKRKVEMQTSIYQKDVSEIYSISLNSFVDVFRDRLAKAKSDGYDKEVTQKSVAEQILQLSELEDFKNRLLPIINEKIYPTVNPL